MQNQLELLPGTHSSKNTTLITLIFLRLTAKAENTPSSMKKILIGSNKMLTTLWVNGTSAIQKWRPSSASFETSTSNSFPIMKCTVLTKWTSSTTYGQTGLLITTAQSPSILTIAKTKQQKITSTSFEILPDNLHQCLQRNYPQNL